MSFPRKHSLRATALLCAATGLLAIPATPALADDTPTPTPTPTASSTVTAPPILASVAALTVPARQTLPGAAPAIAWPKIGRARLDVAGLGTLGRSGSTRTTPIASVTKVMTAYIVLRDHPLTNAQNGPKIVITRAEAASYPRRKAAGESLVKVAAGERITERQALQALLIASGNNMADILARWDAGSRPAFVQEMNRTAAELGMTSTHYADASGLDARSRSTPADLLTLAPLAMAQTTFATIVAQTRATIPLNKLKNTNRLLGRHGVIGLKTGSTHAAGGCLLFATRLSVSGRVYTIYGAMLGAPGPLILTNALAASDKLIVAARAALKPVRILRAGTVVATVTGIDGVTTSLAVAQDVTVVGWGGLASTLSLPTGLQPGQQPATLSVRTAGQALTIPLAPAR